MFATFSNRPVNLNKTKKDETGIQANGEISKVDSKIEAKQELKTVVDKAIIPKSTSEKPVDEKPAPKAVSGRDIISEYKKGDPVALVSYKKICNALSIMDKWEDPAKIQLLEQFVDLSDLFDDKCLTIVHSLAALPWNSIPAEIFPRYQSLLCDIALRQVCHTQTIYNSAVKNLIPKVCSEGDSFALDPAQQNKIYVYAHQIIARIYECLPMSCKLLCSSIKFSFPHYTQPAEVFVGFVRNVIQISEYATKITPEIWDLIIENIVICDVFLTKRESENDCVLSSLFALDEGVVEENMNTNHGVEEKTSKLEGTMKDVLTYITIKQGGTLESIDSSWFRPGNMLKPDDVFRIFMPILEGKMLMSVHSRFSSFIWFYLASLNEQYPQKILEFLWSVITRPQRAQSDAKKAQGASAYMAAFLARAKFIKIGVTFEWISRMFKWLLQYVDQSSGVQTSGGSRHGTFYALCQAFFIVFSFRYKELVKSSDMEEIRRWGLGRVVHSALEPLKYVSKPVGLCFGAITRSLQLVYCNHVLPIDDSVTKPFEEMFPFDVYKLKETAHLISPLMRKFSPLAEDVTLLSNALGNAKEVTENDENGMDFLDNDDDAMIIGSYRERSNTLSMCGAQSSMFTVYSSSPGLRQYDSSYTR